MTQKDHTSSIRIEVPTIRPDDIVDAAGPTDHDYIGQLQYDTLARVAENVTETIEMVTGYTESWTYADGGKPGSYAVYSIADTNAWDKPLVEILRDDQIVGDWEDDELRSLAGELRCTALRSTRTSGRSLQKYDSYDVQAHVRIADK